MIIYRIARTEYCDTSGEGAKRFGGRWNRPGFPALYASSSVSAALLERLTVDPELFSADRYLLYSIMEMDCPDALIQKYEPGQLPAEWDAIPHQQVSEEFGTSLLKSGMLCFGVPSVVDKTSINFVVNPLSERFHLVGISVASLGLDKRIIRN